MGMNCWRCGRVDHASWCSMPGGCPHCGWRPHRWWCSAQITIGWQSGNTFAFHGRDMARSA